MTSSSAGATIENRQLAAESLSLRGGGRTLSLRQFNSADPESALRIGIATERKNMAILLTDRQEEALLQYLLERRAHWCSRRELRAGHLAR